MLRLVFAVGLIAAFGLAAAPAAAGAVPLDQLLDELIYDLRTDGPATGGDHEVGEKMC
jgi:hypothetical protein